MLRSVGFSEKSNRRQSFTHVIQILKSTGRERVKRKGNDVTDVILSLLAGIFLQIVIKPFSV